MNILKASNKHSKKCICYVHDQVKEKAVCFRSFFSDGRWGSLRGVLCPKELFIEIFSRFFELRGNIKRGVPNLLCLGGDLLKIT